MDMEVTRLRPASGLFAGKRIYPDGRIHSDVQIKKWRHERLRFASLEALQDDLQRTQRENCCLIRGATENTAQPIQRLKKEFADVPTTFFALDVENVRHPDWLDDAPAAVDASVIAPLRSFVGDAGYLVTLTGTAGLIRDPETKAWGGKVGGDEIRCRIYFHLHEPLDSARAKKLMLLMREKLPGIDIALGNEVQIHYCARAQFVGRGAFDPVFDRKVPLLWLRSGGYLAVPPDLDHDGSWAEAEERARTEDNSRDVDHPDAESAIAGIGSDGEIYPHIRCSARRLVREGRFDNLSPEEQAYEIFQLMRGWAEKHRGAILGQSKREWQDIQVRLERGRDYALWLLERDDQVRGRGVVRKCIAWSEPACGLSLEAGREALARAGDAFIEAFDQAEEGTDDSFEPHELVRALRSTLGGGKSRMGHDVIPRLIARAIADDASVILACARHTLGAEQQERFMQRYACKDLVCGQWRGRQADDPEIPGHPMCERHEEARAVGLAGGEPTLLCRSGQARCEFYETCGYRRQQRGHAHVWFVAHSALLHERPENIGTPVAVIIDENPVPAMLFGIDDEVELALAALNAPPRGLGLQDNIDLHRFRQALWTVFERLGLGPVPLQELRTCFSAHPVVAPEVGRMIALEWLTLAPLKVHPGMSKDEVLEAAEGCGENNDTLRRIDLYTLIAEAIEDGTVVSGRIWVINRGKTGRVIRMCGVRQVRAGWKAPILALDATLDLTLLRRIWPAAEPIVDDIKFAMSPHVRVTQTVDAPFSKSWLTHKKHEVARAREVYGAILGEIILAGTVGPTLIITHKAVEETLRRVAHIPDWVELAHHGDITGVDRWRDCRNVVVIGRPLPAPEDACRTAEALFGEHIPRRAYTPVKVNIRIVPDAKGHTAVEVTQHRHDDPHAEAVRLQVTEAGILQAAGRARWVARTEQTPLDIWLLTDVRCEELEPVHARLWSEFPCGADALMLAKGVWLESHADAAVAYPDLFKSAAAVGLQRRRASKRSSIHRRLSMDRRSFAPPAAVYAVRYRQPRAGSRPATALFLAQVVPDALTWLRAKLGAGVKLVEDGS